MLKYLKKHILFLSVFFVFFSVNASCKMTHLSKNDDILLKQLIEKAHKENKTLNLENRTYKISKSLNITCSINGNNALFLPMVKQTVAINFKESNISISNLKIKGDGFKMLDVSGDYITFNNCEFETKNYFVLLRISGNNCVIKNSSLRNFYNLKKQFVIKNKQGVSIKNLTVEKCKTNGGFYLMNEQLKEIGNYVFKNNDILVDYSHANQNIKNQNDGFHFGGIKGVNIVNNTIKFVNVTRGFKMTDYQPKVGKVISQLPTTDVLIKSNKIISTSSNGKQLFDFFDGTAKIDIIGNYIDSKGHTTIFEDKTTYLLNVPRELNITDNKIYYDYRILYYRGAKSSTLLNKNVSLNVVDNEFYFTQKVEEKSIKRLGSELEIKLQYPIYARSINNFNFTKNSFSSTVLEKPFKATRFIYVLDVLDSNISNNILGGGVLYGPTEKGNLKYESNKVTAITFKELIDVRPLTSEQKTEVHHNLIVKNNDIRTSRKQLKLSSGKISSNKKNKLILAD